MNFASVLKQDVEDPRVLASMAPVHDAAQVVGYSGDLETFGQDLYQLGRGVLDARNLVLEPFGPYYKYAGARQSWRMFGVVNA